MTGTQQSAAPLKPTEAPRPSALRGLSAQASERGAELVLAEVPWEGQAPDPDVLSAKDFLALL